MHTEGRGQDRHVEQAGEALLAAGAHQALLAQDPHLPTPTTAAPAPAAPARFSTRLCGRRRPPPTGLDPPARAVSRPGPGSREEWGEEAELAGKRSINRMCACECARVCARARACSVGQAGIKAQDRLPPTPPACAMPPPPCGARAVGMRGAGPGCCGPSPCPGSRGRRPSRPMRARAFVRARMRASRAHRRERVRPRAENRGVARPSPRRSGAA